MLLPNLLTEVKYKKASPAQIKRDKERAIDRQKNNIHSSPCDKSTSLDGKNSKSVDQNKSNNNTEESGDIDTVNSSAEEESQQGSSDNIYESEISGNATGGESGTSGQGGANDSGDQAGIKCNECGECANGNNETWFKCTSCEDYDICKPCREKGCHKYHNGQIQEFSEPAFPANGFCNACGLQFNPKRTWFEVYNCTVCEDYALCFKCKRLCLHSQHRHHLSRIPLDQYLKIIK